MIIMLYESNYPIVQYEEPGWSGLPIGFFQVDQRTLRDLNNNSICNLWGYFLANDIDGILRPRSGEHLLAAFAYRKERYLYISTLSYSDVSIERKQKWWARLGLSKQIKKW